MSYVQTKAEELASLTGDNLAGACGEEILYLKNTHTLATAKLYLSKIRSAIRAFNPEHPALDHLILDRQDYQVLNAAKERGNYKDITHLRPIVPSAVIKRARSLCLSPDPAELAVGLMLLCGRRGVELVRQGQFGMCVPQDLADWEADIGYRLTNPEQHIWFRGQAKVRGDAERVAIGYPIPLLCPASEFLEDWRRFKETGRWQQGDFNNQTAILFGQIVQRSFSEPQGRAWRPKDLRSAYAEIAYALFAPEKRKAKVISYEAYFSQILGHREGRVVGGQFVRDIRTAQSYRDFTLVWDENGESQVP